MGFPFLNVFCYFSGSFSLTFLLTPVSIELETGLFGRVVDVSCATSVLSIGDCFVLYFCQWFSTIMNDVKMLLEIGNISFQIYTDVFLLHCCSSHLLDASSSAHRGHSEIEIECIACFVTSRTLFAAVWIDHLRSIEDHFRFHLALAEHSSEDSLPFGTIL